MTITALSPSRIDLGGAVETLPLCSTQVCDRARRAGQRGVRGRDVVGHHGDQRQSGRRRVQPHIVSGFGDSVTNECSGTVAPLPGNTVAVVGRGVGVEPAEHVERSGGVPRVGVLLEAHIPNPLVRRLWRRMPMAWNGPVIHRSMWLRGDALTELLTATLPLLPAMSPPVV